MTTVISPYFSSACQAIGSDLATVNNDQDEMTAEFVANQFKESTWIGVSSQPDVSWFEHECPLTKNVQTTQLIFNQIYKLKVSAIFNTGYE